MTPANAIAEWKQAGVYPFNQSAIEVPSFDTSSADAATAVCEFAHTSGFQIHKNWHFQTFWTLPPMAMLQKLKFTRDLSLQKKPKIEQCESTTVTVNTASAPLNSIFDLKKVPAFHFNTCILCCNRASIYIHVCTYSHLYTIAVCYPARVCASGVKRLLLSVCQSVHLSVCPSIILKYLSNTSLRGIAKLHKRQQNSRNGSILASVYLAEVKAVALAVISSGYRSQALLYMHSDQRYIRR